MERPDTPPEALLGSSEPISQHRADEPPGSGPVSAAPARVGVMARLGTAPHAWLAIAAALLAGCGPGLPERGSGDEAPRVDLTPKPAGLAFEPPVLDLGRVVPGGFVEGMVYVRNVSREAVEVIDYNAPCECTNATPELPRTLRPGESFRFPVRLDLSSLFRGGLRSVDDDEPEIVERSITLWTSLGRSAELDLRVEVSEELEVEPIVVDFGAVVRGEAAERTVTVSPGRARPDRPVGILAIARPGPGPHPEIEEVRVGPAVELRFRLPPLTEPGAFESRVELVTDAEPDPVPLLVRAEAVEPVLVVPERLEVPAAPPGRPVVARLHVRRRDGAPLVLRAVRGSSSRIRVEELGPSPGGGRAVQVVVAVPAWPEETTGSVVLETDFPGVAGRLTVPVRVRGRPPR